MNDFAISRIKEFRTLLKHAAQIIQRGSYNQFQYLKDQHYVGVTDTKTARIAYRRLKRAARKGIRIVADMEEGKVDKHGRPDDNGRSVALCCGFTSQAGHSFTFALAHPDSGASERCRRLNTKLVKRLLRDGSIKKSFHYGPYDTDAIERLLQTKVKGYDYDTLIGEFLRDPNARAYGLASIADRRFPDFANYKDIRYPEAFTQDYTKDVKRKKTAKTQQIEKADKTGKMNLARLPWKKMVLYNGADCHLEKLVEDTTIKHVNQPLMGVYVDSGHVLYRMQHDTNCRPRFDYDWYDKIEPLLKARVKLFKKQVQQLAGGKYVKIKNAKGKTEKKRFNPASPGQVYWLLYKKLNYAVDEENANTRAGTIKHLAIKHPKLNCIWQLREIEKELSMANSYKNCADLNNGDLATIWKQTGTRTGRLSSGKTKERSDDHVINFQNIHGDALIKCLFVATKLWKKVYKYWLKHGDFTEKTWKIFKHIKILLGFDFSQNELRQLAEESGDKNLIKMFSSGLDPHVEVGHEITGWAKEKIAHNDRVRKLIKNIQFGLVYGLQGEGLFRFVIAQGVKTTLKEVMEFHARYFKRFPGVKKLQKYYRDMADKYGYVVNVFGFKRKLTGQDANEEGHFIGNVAINTPIQGASHQLLLMALAALYRKEKQYTLLKYVLMEIHDSLFFRVELKDLMEAARIGQRLMVKEPVNIVEHDFKLKKRVPLQAKAKAGFRFGVQIEGVGSKELDTEYKFLNAWCRENKKLEKSLYKQADDLGISLSV